MSMFQPNEMDPKKFLTYDQKIGRLFIVIPWIFVVPVCAILTFIAIDGFILPSIEGRQWSPPDENQLKWQTGFMLSNRFNSQSPYTFEVGGKDLILNCSPHGPPQDCMGRLGVIGNTAQRFPMRIAIFDVHNYAGTVHVIAAANIGNKPVLSFSQQRASLLIDANIEDSSKKLPVFRLGLAIIVLLYVAIGMTYKLLYSFSHKS